MGFTPENQDKLNAYEQLLFEREENKRLKAELKRTKYLQMLLDRRAETGRKNQAHYDEVTSDEHLTFDARERALIQEGFRQ